MPRWRQRREGSVEAENGDGEGSRAGGEKEMMGKGDEVLEQ
jgi:hypothetical protein